MQSEAADKGAFFLHFAQFIFLFEFREFEVTVKGTDEMKKLLNSYKEKLRQWYVPRFTNFFKKQIFLMIFV